MNVKPLLCPQALVSNYLISSLLTQKQEVVISNIPSRAENPQLRRFFSAAVAFKGKTMGTLQVLAPFCWAPRELAHQEDTDNRSLRLPFLVPCLLISNCSDVLAMLLIICLAGC